MELDDKFKQLIKELGTAINESLSDSEKIADVMARIRSAGYDLFLVLEVTVGFNKRGDSERAKRGRASGSRRRETREFHLSSADAEFLRDLKIKVDEETR